MRESNRPRALDAALQLMESAEGGSITLDAVARAAGITKPGLMYHFPTREALMLAIVEHAATRLETAMLGSLARPFEESTPGERVRAYARAVALGPASRAEYAIFTEAAYRPALEEPWVRRLAPWFAVPDAVDPATRARLVTARLAADGLWAALATGVFAPSEAERDGVLALVDDLTHASSEEEA